VPFPEPTGPAAPRAEVLLGYLDYFRSLVLSKAQGLSDAQLRVSLLPSGWTVLELVKHLTHLEQRWLGLGSTSVEAPVGGEPARGVSGVDGRARFDQDDGPRPRLTPAGGAGCCRSGLGNLHQLLQVVEHVR